MARSLYPLVAAILLVPLVAPAASGQEKPRPARDKYSTAAAPCTVDHRYAPVWWQTAICLPDDWQKTLVDKEGGLLYDYRGRFHDFKTRITVGLEGGDEWLRQELVAPRVPIVRTLKRQGKIELVEEAYAVAPPLAPAKGHAAETPPVIERLDKGAGQADWAHPSVPCDPALRRVAIGWNEAIRYRVNVKRPANRANDANGKEKEGGRKEYTVVFGLCEGWHPEAGQRVLLLRIEGKTRKTVDMVAEKGRNVPAMFAFEARDDDGEGHVDLEVAAAPGSPDRNTILNTLWVFEGKAAPLDELLAGKSKQEPLARVDCGAETPRMGPPRHDAILATVRVPEGFAGTLVPLVTIESELPVRADPEKHLVAIGDGTLLSCTRRFTVAAQSGGKTVLRCEPVDFAPGKRRGSPRPGEDFLLAVGVLRGGGEPVVPRCSNQAFDLRRKAEAYWSKLDLPYDVIRVPDAGIQAQLDAAIRNIYQAREIKDGLPAFQVGPTCYRGLWVVDGSFLLEAVTFLGRAKEARAGIQYLLGFQRDDGGIMLIDGHWKETGIALWAVTRHARLTGDRQWLRSVWPKVERGFAYIGTMRETTRKDPNAPNYGLIPEGFSDGGLAGRMPEYTNVYWTMVGMKAAVEAARWLDKRDEAERWQQEYDDFYATFQKAAGRDMKPDAHGNRCLPIRMRDPDHVPPQKAQWGFLHAVFPGQVFRPGDPLVTGNMAMLKACECEGLVFDTGWVKDGLWNYFGSFYAHAWLWLGDGRKAARTLYAFANHASPLLCWREEQKPQGKGPQVCGDMPHNWASAEFIRLVRDLLVLERGDELHLLEGMPPEWAGPGAVTELRGVLTEFGPVSLKLAVSPDGRSATFHLDPPRRNPPKRIVLHLDGRSGRQGTLDVPLGAASVQQIPIGRPD